MISLSTLINAIKTNYDKIKRAGLEDTYFSIAKTMQNANITNVVNLHDNRKRVKKATLSGIDYERFPNYQGGLGNKLINNEVPSMFQSDEIWSQFRYGIHNPSTFYSAACGTCSASMVLSYVLDKTITPVDVKNMLEQNNTIDKIINTIVATPSRATRKANYDYRQPGFGTKWEAVGKYVPIAFDLANLAVNNNQVLAVNSGTNHFTDTTTMLNYLKAGVPIIARCEKNGCFTSSQGGHFIVIAGVNEDDIKDNKPNDQIRIYVTDPAYYHHTSNKRTGKKRRVCLQEYYLSDFQSNGAAKATMFWAFGKDEVNKGNYILNETFNYKQYGGRPWNFVAE